TLSGRVPCYPHSRTRCDFLSQPPPSHHLPSLTPPSPSPPPHSFPTRRSSDLSADPGRLPADHGKRPSKASCPESEKETRYLRELLRGENFENLQSFSPFYRLDLDYLERNLYNDYVRIENIFYV